MPKRKLVKPSDETLALIKQAHERGKSITEEEALKRKSSAYRVQTPALPFGATISKVKKGKRGELRFWTADRPKGPGQLEMPLTRALQELERDYLTQVEKLRRCPPTHAAAKARTVLSKRQAIEQAWRRIGMNSRQAAKEIAKRLHVSDAYARKIRAKMRQSEGT